MNTNWIKILWFFLLASCAQSENKFKGTFELIETYFDIENMKEGDRVLVYSKYTGCVSCRNMIDKDWKTLANLPNLFIITNHKMHKVYRNDIVFDTLDIINTTDLGFSGPSLFIKKNGQLKFEIELEAHNKDSFASILGFTL